MSTSATSPEIIEQSTVADSTASLEQFAPAANRTRRRRTTVDEYDSILWRMQSQVSIDEGVATLYGVVGTGKGAGATVVASNLANRLVDHVDGPVLLVDANFYRPRIDRLLKLKKNPGLTELLTDDLPLSEAVQPTKVAGLNVLASGRAGKLEQIGLNPDAVTGAIYQMREEYAAVVFDFSEATNLGPSILLAQKCDGVLMVARSEKTRRTLAKHAVDQLQQDGVKVIGAVLNRHRDYVPGWIRKWG